MIICGSLSLYACSKNHYKIFLRLKGTTIQVYAKNISNINVPIYTIFCKSWSSTIFFTWNLNRSEIINTWNICFEYLERRKYESIITNHTKNKTPTWFMQLKIFFTFKFRMPIFMLWFPKINEDFKAALLHLYQFPLMLKRPQKLVPSFFEPPIFVEVSPCHRSTCIS